MLHIICSICALAHLLSTLLGPWCRPLRYPSLALALLPHDLQARLMEERGKLEAAVSAQLEEERAALLEKKRREQVGLLACCGV